MRLKVVIHEAAESCLSVDIDPPTTGGHDRIMDIAI